MRTTRPPRRIATIPSESSRRRFKGRLRTERLAEQEFVRAGGDIVRDDADLLEAETCVKTLGAGVEGGDAHEDVGGLAEDALLGESEQAGADATVARIGRDREAEDVAADERDAQGEGDDAEDLIVGAGG